MWNYILSTNSHIKVNFISNIIPNYISNSATNIPFSWNLTYNRRLYFELPSVQGMIDKYGSVLIITHMLSEISERFRQCPPQSEAFLTGLIHRHVHRIRLDFRWRYVSFFPTGNLSPCCIQEELPLAWLQVASQTPILPSTSSFSRQVSTPRIYSHIFSPRAIYLIWPRRARPSLSMSATLLERSVGGSWSSSPGNVSEVDQVWTVSLASIPLKSQFMFFFF